MTILNKYALAYLLNDRDLSAIFQLYIVQCMGCGIIFQKGSGVTIPVYRDDGQFLNKYCEVCLNCNDPIRRRLRELRQEDFNLEPLEQSSMQFH